VAILRKLDKDNDGVISFLDFKNSVYPYINRLLVPSSTRETICECGHSKKKKNYIETEVNENNVNIMKNNSKKDFEEDRIKVYCRTE
jgi:CDGSH-type Zn-finger protein